jgi:hypothetical protein
LQVGDLRPGVGLPGCCKFHQTRFRNTVVFWGGAAGLIAILASGVLYYVNTRSSIYHNARWLDRVNVHYFHSYSGTHSPFLLSNSGSGTVLVSEITVYSGIYYNVPFYVGKSIASGEFLSMPIVDFNPEYIGLE